MTFPIVHSSIHQYPSIPTHPLRSLQISRIVFPKDQNKYSNLQVLESAAGFYIGTIFTSSEGYSEPGSRDSSYFKTLIQAQRALDYLEVLSSHEPKNHPLDIPLWESKLTAEFRYKVQYRCSP